MDAQAVGICTATISDNRPKGRAYRQSIASYVCQVYATEIATKPILHIIVDRAFDDAFNRGFSIGTFAIKHSLKGCMRVYELVAMRDKRFQMYLLERNHIQSESVSPRTISPRALQLDFSSGNALYTAKAFLSRPCRAYRCCTYGIEASMALIPTWTIVHPSPVKCIAVAIHGSAPVQSTTS